MDNSGLIRRIEIRLKELGRTKEEFYRGTGISSASYSQWNTGKYGPSKRKMQAVADYLGVPVSYLTGEEDAEASTREAARPSEADIKFALFGGDGEITDAMYAEVKDFAAFVMQREQKKKGSP